MICKFFNSLLDFQNGLRNEKNMDIVGRLEAISSLIKTSVKSVNESPLFLSNVLFSERFLKGRSVPRPILFNNKRHRNVDPQIELQSTFYS